MIETSKIVISGGPGSGKTTIINSLKNLGHFCYNEISRDLIEKNRKNGGQIYLLKTHWNSAKYYGKKGKSNIKTL